MYRFHRYNLIRWDISSPSVAYKLFVRGLYDYAIVKEETSSGVTTRGYFVAAKGLETSWTNRASLTYSIDIRGRKLVNEGQNWLAAAGRTFTGLLDTYGGAAVAYSLQLLSSSYSGNCVTVRRASDNATQNIGFDGQDLDIAALESFCTGTDGFVSVWYDQSGNGANATQTTASSQPKIVSAGSVILENGKPTIIADGVDDYLQSGIISFTNPVTMFMVNRKISGVNTVTGLNNGASITGLRSLSTGYVYYQQGPQYSPNFGDNNQNLLYAKTSTIGTDWEAGANSILATNSGENVGTVTPNQITISARGNGTLPMNAATQAFIVYNSDQSSNRVAIETALNDYYNIF